MISKCEGTIWKFPHHQTPVSNSYSSGVIVTDNSVGFPELFLPNLTRNRHVSHMRAHTHFSLMYTWDYTMHSVLKLVFSLLNNISWTPFHVNTYKIYLIFLNSYIVWMCCYITISSFGLSVSIFSYHKQWHSEHSCTGVPCFSLR